MKHRIIGDSMQTVALELHGGESVFSTLGTMLFVRGAIESVTAPDGPYWSGITSTLVKNNDPQLVAYSCSDGAGLVSFRIPGPGKIHRLNLDGSSRVIIRRSAFFASSEGVLMDPLILDGEDSGEIPSGHFITVSGSGQLFLHGAGNLVDINLAPGERMAVDGQQVLTMDGGIDYSPRPVGKPGDTGESPYILLMHLTGPGRIVLHTMPGKL